MSSVANSSQNRMEQYSLNTVISILQTAISPVVLISGVGLLILSQANRMMHVAGRIRQLQAEYEKNPDNNTRQQIQWLYERAKLIRLSLMAMIGCILCDVLVILLIFVSKLFGWESGIPILLIFSFGLVLLVVSLILFVCDVNKNLHALKIVIASH